MHEGIVFSLLTGFLILSIYLNVINGHFNQLQNWLARQQQVKLSLISISLISFPSLIWFTFYFIRSNSFASINDLIPAQVQAALISASIAWWISDRRNKTQLVFDFHKEFNSTELYKARREAEKTLEEENNPKSKEKPEKLLSFTDIYKKYKKERKSRSIWLVVRFYERLWLAIEYNQVNSKLVPKLFGDNFNWWYKHYFLKQLVELEKTQASNNIRNLKNWMDNNPKEQHKTMQPQKAENTEEK